MSTPRCTGRTRSEHGRVRRYGYFLVPPARGREQDEQIQPSTGNTHSAANAIVSLWLASATDQPVDQLIELYMICATLAERCSWPTEERDLFLKLISRQMIIDHDRLPGVWRLEMEERLLGVDSSSEPRHPATPPGAS
jgi:hypothetical protein